MKTYLLAAAGLAMATLVSGGAFAADIAGPAPVVEAPAAATDNWSGFYAGVQAGIGVVKANLSDSTDGTFYDGSATQATAGVYAGLNWVDNSFLVGLEGDVNYHFGSGESAMGPGAPAIPTGWRTQSTWDASLRARLGFLPSENFLVFATGGVAAQDFSLDNPTCVGCAIWNTTNMFGGTQWGGVVGGGVEYALTSQIHVKAEYLHTFFPTDGSAGGFDGVDSAKSNDAVRLGISTRF